MLTNRRYLGLSFAYSHLLHGLLILALAMAMPDFWAATSVAAVVAGGIGFVLIGLMAATSNDRAVAWLGRRRWTTLHTVGLYYLWFILAFTYSASAAHSPYRIGMTAILLFALGLRVRAYWAARRYSAARMA